jgi:hypothetical protein
VHAPIILYISFSLTSFVVTHSLHHVEQDRVHLRQARPLSLTRPRLGQRLRGELSQRVRPAGGGDRGQRGGRHHPRVARVGQGCVAREALGLLQAEGGRAVPRLAHGRR